MLRSMRTPQNAKEPVLWRQTAQSYGDIELVLVAHMEERVNGVPNITCHERADEAFTRHLGDRFAHCLVERSESIAPFLLQRTGQYLCENEAD